MANGDSCSNFNKGEKIFCCVKLFFFFLLFKTSNQLCVFLLSSCYHKVEDLLCIASCCRLVLKFIAFNFQLCTFDYHSMSLL
jgi:hypothetical protein